MNIVIDMEATISSAETSTLEKIGVTRYLEDMLMCPAIEAIQYKAQVAHVNRSLPGWYLVDELKACFIEAGLQAGRALKLARALWLLNEGHGYLPNGHGNYRSYWLVPELIDVYNVVRERLRILYRVTDWARRFTELTWARTWSRVCPENPLNEKLTRLSRQLIDSMRHRDTSYREMNAYIDELWEQQQFPKHIVGIEPTKENLNLYYDMLLKRFSEWVCTEVPGEVEPTIARAIESLDRRGLETGDVQLSSLIYQKLGITELNDSNVIAVVEAYLEWYQQANDVYKLMYVQELLHQLRKLKQ